MKRMTKCVLIVLMLGAGMASAVFITALIHEDSFSCPQDARYCKVVIQKNGKSFRSFYITKGDYELRVYATYKVTTTTTSTSTTTITSTSTTTTTTTTMTTTSSTTTTTQGSGIGICGKVEVPCPPEFDEPGIPCTIDLPCLTTTTTQGGIGIGCARTVGCSYCPNEISCYSWCIDIENGCIDCNPFYIGECPEGCVTLIAFMPCG